MVHALNDAFIMVLETEIGHMLDEGATFQETVLPILLGFSILSVIASLVLMWPIHQRAHVNAALAEAMKCEGDEGGAAQGKEAGDEQTGV